MTKYIVGNVVFKNKNMALKEINRTNIQFREFNQVMLKNNFPNRVKKMVVLKEYKPKRLSAIDRLSGMMG